MAAAENGRLGAQSSMFFRMMFKALSARNSRTLVAVSSILVGAAVVSALTSLYLDISIKMSEELRAFGANFYVRPKVSSDDRGLSQSTYDAIATTIPQDKRVGGSPFLYGIARLDLGSAVVAGVDFQGLRAISPYWRVDGSWVGVSFDERNCMIGRRLAESMELHVGDTVNVISREQGVEASLSVKGIVDTGDAEDEQVFVNLSLAQRLFGMADTIDYAMFSIVAQGTDAEELAKDINTRFGDVEAKPIRKISQSDGEILEKIEGLMALVAGTILVITTLCVNATLTAMVAERSAEIGLQKALGAGNRTIMVQFLSETALICLIGVILGVVLGFGVAQLLGQAVFNAWVTFRPAVFPLTLFASMAAAVVAAVIPVLGAMNVVPARVLKGE